MRVNFCAASTHHKRTQAASGRHRAGRRHRAKALVLVLVRCQHHVGFGQVQDVPHRGHRAVVAIGRRSKARMVPGRRHTRLRGGQLLLEPLGLR